MHQHDLQNLNSLRTLTVYCSCSGSHPKPASRHWHTFSVLSEHCILHTHTHAEKSLGSSLAIPDKIAQQTRFWVHICWRSRLYQDSYDDFMTLDCGKFHHLIPYLAQNNCTSGNGEMTPNKGYKLDLCIVKGNQTKDSFHHWPEVCQHKSLKHKSYSFILKHAVLVMSRHNRWHF